MVSRLVLLPRHHLYDILPLAQTIAESILSLEQIEPSRWERCVLTTLLHNIRVELACSSKELMTPLRHALTGMKVSLVKLFVSSGPTCLSLSGWT